LGSDNGFPTPIAAKLAGATAKTLEHWAKRGFVRPSVSAGFPARGGTRIWSHRDVIAIRVALGLSKQGVRLRHLRRIVNFVRQREGLSLTTSDVLATTSLVYDGREVYEVTGDTLVSTLRKPGQCELFVVCLDQIVRELLSKMRELENSSERIEPGERRIVTPLSRRRAPSSSRQPNLPDQSDAPRGARRRAHGS
jgi:DNA-binding transcriptional MerR regulator